MASYDLLLLITCFSYATFQTSKAEIPTGNVSADVVLEETLQFLCDVMIDSVICLQFLRHSPAIVIVISDTFVLPVFH